MRWMGKVKKYLEERRKENKYQNSRFKIVEKAHALPIIIYWVLCAYVFMNKFETIDFLYGLKGFDDFYSFRYLFYDGFSGAFVMYHSTLRSIFLVCKYYWIQMEEGSRRKFFQKVDSSN